MRRGYPPVQLTEEEVFKICGRLCLSVPSIEVLTFAFLVAFKVSFTPARSFRPFPPLSKVPFLGKRKPRQQPYWRFKY
jgi:hypothetical protein